MSKKTAQSKSKELADAVRSHLLKRQTMTDALLLAKWVGTKPKGKNTSEIEPAQAGRENPPNPVHLLASWREITAALGMKHSEKGKGKSLNERFDGPIPKPAKGSQPIVEKTHLLQWWNSLAVIQQELANRREGAKLSAESQHNYGRAGISAPEIGGGVKKRRKNKR